ncbi:MAG: hypothetical protein ABEJ36_04840 [Candidatus Nanosalina sp.]
MNYSGADDLVTPDDALSEEQLERFPGEPEKSRIQVPGHEEWVYEDGTVVYSAEAYGFLADLIENDVLEGEKALTGVDREKLQNAAARVKGVKSPIAWVNEDAYEKGDVDEDLPVDGSFYFQEEMPMSVQMRGSGDLADRLAFLRSPKEVDDTDVLRDDLEEVGEDERGMIDRINAQLGSSNFVVPVVYSDSGHPVRRRRVAFVYRPEDQSGLNEDFDNFMKSLSERKGDALKAELETYSGTSKESGDVVSIDPGIPERPPELSVLEDDTYQLDFYARDYEDSEGLEVEMDGDRITVIDEEGGEVASRDVEFDRELDKSDLEDLEVEDLTLNNGVGTAILSRL